MQSSSQPASGRAVILCPSVSSAGWKVPPYMVRGSEGPLLTPDFASRALIGQLSLGVPRGPPTEERAWLSDWDRLGPDGEPNWEGAPPIESGVFPNIRPLLSAAVR